MAPDDLVKRQSMHDRCETESANIKASDLQDSQPIPMKPITNVSEKSDEEQKK